ncbi:MAG: hypothetical protein JWR26_3616 [Pedosphaera sp.]|nr:hypothetical protein [Pedosphaera sp.]
MLPPQTPGLSATPVIVPACWKCPTCRAIKQFPANPLDGHFKSTALVCSVCKEPHKIWDIILGLVRESSMWFGFSPLGATTSIFSTKIFRDTETHIDLQEYGLAKNAVILDINFTPDGGLFCFEMAGNTRRQRQKGAKLQLRGYKSFTLKDNSEDEAIVNIAVTWVESSEADFAWNNLVAAFDAYADQNLQGAIVPANVAMENRLYNLMAQEFGSACGKERLKDFLEGAATYSYQLNVLLPYIARVRSIPVLDDTLRGLLNRLRGFRNDIAHKGHAGTDLTKDACAELLTAVVFGVRYLELFSAIQPSAAPHP